MKQLEFAFWIFFGIKELLNFMGMIPKHTHIFLK